LGGVIKNAVALFMFAMVLTRRTPNGSNQKIVARSASRIAMVAADRRV
jgi:hypothetical protein